MDIKNNKGTEITNLDSWKNAFLEVDHEIHWKVGRSAYSLAYHFTTPTIDNSYGLQCIKNSLCELGFHNIEFINAEIEHESKFDCFRNGRIQDIIIWAKNNNQTIVIGIEAKVDEVFNESIAKAYLEAKNKWKQNPRSNAKERIEKICSKYFPDEPIEEIDIRYQLLYYLEGTIAEAKKVKGMAYMPILVYHTDDYNDKIGCKNKSAFEEFMKKMNFCSLKSSLQSTSHYHNKIDGVNVFCSYIEIEKEIKNI